MSAYNVVTKNETMFFNLQQVLHSVMHDFVKFLRDEKHLTLGKLEGLCPTKILESKVYF